MTYEEIIGEILQYSKPKLQFSEKINRSSLLKYILNKYPSFDKRDLDEVIQEMNYRGDLLAINNEYIIIDPAFF